MIGAVALGGGVHRLARQVVLKQAMGLILTGDIIDAAAADRIGIITELVDHEALDDTVNAWCQKILRCAPLATRASKQTVLSGLDDRAGAGDEKQKTYSEFKLFYDSADRYEGAKAFAEKAAPRWTGT